MLDVDAEYRREAAANALKTIAPLRFNPTGEAWLPVLHTSRGRRHYTALFSNTARAHQLRKTRDWVVLYYDGRDGEHQCTLITAEFGRLKGRRIVRGREDECEQFYRKRGELRPRSSGPSIRQALVGFGLKGLVLSSIVTVHTCDGVECLV